MPAAPEEQAAVQRAAMAAEKQMADFDKSLQVFPPSGLCCFPHLYWCEIQ
jgi:hypothetical protein